MARAIWKGSISFGLVNIPIALYAATRREELKFRLVRKTDLSPVNYKRVAEKDGKEVPWDQIVKGYEYEKGKFVVLQEEDFQRVDLEATQTVDIQDFVDLEEIDPMFFYKPYYLEPQKGGDKAYALLRDALKDTKKVGVAKVVIKTRQYLAGFTKEPRTKRSEREKQRQIVARKNIAPGQQSSVDGSASPKTMTDDRSNRRRRKYHSAKPPLVCQRVPPVAAATGLTGALETI